MDPTIIALSSTAKKNKTACERAVNTTFHPLFLLPSSFFLLPPLYSSSLERIFTNTWSALHRNPNLSAIYPSVPWFSTMSSIAQNIQKKSYLPKKNSLPVSHPDSNDQQPGLRRRLSSLSLKIQPISSQTTSWAFQRSKSVSAIGEYAGTSIRKWWDWGWTWILSKKPVLAQDLEMNEEETRILECHNKGSWRHVFYKVRSEVRKLIVSDKTGLPQTCKYTSFDYSQNFVG